MGLCSFCYKTNTKISQATGLRDPECGCSLSPLILRRGADPDCIKVPHGARRGQGMNKTLPDVPSTLPQVRRVMTVLGKIKAFSKWYGKGIGFSEPKPEAKGIEKKAAEPPETKVEAPEKKGDESSSK